jgi:site-specific DNA-methyltransferase (adenine-specific)
VPKKSKPAKRLPKGVSGLRSEASTRQASDAGRVTRTEKPLYRQKLPKAKASRQDLQNSQDKNHSVHSVDSVKHPHFPAPAHFELREDGSIQKIKGSATVPVASFGVPPNEMPENASGETPNAAGGTPALPRLIFTSDNPFVRLYHGNSLELLDAIAAKYPEGRFDAIFADPPYFLSNGGITCHAGKMVKVDKGDWDVSRGPALNHEFNREWLLRCQKVLKPNGTIWVTGTHHVIFSIGYALQQLGFKILNDIAWEKPNPPPNLSCRYFTHSTETVLWAAKSEKSKHVFNYQEMRKVTGKQMKTVWRNLPESREEREEGEGNENSGGSLQRPSEPSRPSRDISSVWTLVAPGSAEKEHGKHPTQKPIALVERCLLASTNEGDLVLDPFLGGGTTAVVSLRLKRGCVGVELDLHNVEIAARRVDCEIIEIWLHRFRVRIDVSVFGGASAFTSRFPNSELLSSNSQIDLAIFPDSINGSRRMAGVPEIQTERIFHECKFVFLSCAQVERGAVVHTTVDVSLQEAWAKTPTGKKRETTHIVRCETEIFRLKINQT